MSKDWVIFLDDGDVMNDNRLRGAQWLHWLGQFFSKRYGSSTRQWAEGNRQFIEGFSYMGYLERRFGRIDVTFSEFESAYAEDWLGAMFSSAKVPMPSLEEHIPLLREATVFVTERVRADFPGTIETVRKLKARGYTLHTAAMSASYDQAGTLQGLGLLECFDNLYGSDLVDCLKVSPEYYRRMFVHAGVEANRALVLDNSVTRVRWALEVRARGVLVGEDKSDWDGEHLSSLPELLDLLD